MVTILLNETFVKIQEKEEGYSFLHTSMYEYVGDEENPFEGKWGEVHAPVFLPKETSWDEEGYEKAISSLFLQCSLLDREDAEQILYALWVYLYEEH